MNNHPWKLVGPWYRWQHPGLPSAGRLSCPVFQKYDGSTLVAEFLKDPQRSLRFTEEDFVHEIKPLAPLAPYPPYPLTNPKPRRLSELGYFPTATRKLFLDTHKRFYLVVCELHCDMPGFPAVNREQVCDAGFVVRRRVVSNLTQVALAEAQPIFQRLTTARQSVLELAGVQPEAQLGLVKKGLAPQGEAMLAGAIAESIDMNQTVALAQIGAERANLAEWAGKFGVSLRLKGWKQIREGVGVWIDVEENSQTAITEQVFRLCPLIPDPREALHSGKGRTIYFGAVPTGSGDTDEFGTSRFDDVTQYEIRCFVRRYKHEPPNNGRNPKCCGEVVWSLPTEVYQLAPHFDLVGTNNRPISMKLPDLKALEAQAASLPPNQLAPFRMVSPPNSNFEVSINQDFTGLAGSRSSEICSFSIPLITIVATFVFKLFLPVVTLLFGLFFLLKLKFCIPPSINLNAIAKQLHAELQGGLDVGVDQAIETKFSGAIDVALTKEFGADVLHGLKNGVPNVSSGFGPRAIAEMTDSILQSGEEKNAPSLTAKLQYEAHVEAEVVA